MKARDVLEFLRPAYSFDAVEADGKLLFKPRGTSPSVIIPYSRYVVIDKDRGVTVKSKLAQATELPAQVNVRFLTVEKPHEPVTEQSQLLTTSSYRTDTIDMVPMILSRVRGKKAADRILLDAHAGMKSRAWATGPEYDYLDPANVIGLTLKNGTVVVVKIETKKDTGARIEWESTDQDPAGYTSTGSGSSQVQVGNATVPNLVGITKLVVMDIPPLRNLDNTPMLYVAVTQYGGIEGASIVQKSDDGSDFENLVTVDTQSVIGYAENVLGGWTNTNIADELNTLTVRVIAGTFSSVTYAEFLKNIRYLLVGNEIIKFRTATPQSISNQWVLSGFLRGRRSTHSYINTHTANEVVVLLTEEATRAIGYDLTDLNALRYYRGMTIGIDSTQYADPEIVQNRVTGNFVKSFPPSNIVGIWLPNGDVLIRFRRRARYNAIMINDTGVPLYSDEAPETYDIDVLNATGTAVVRPINGQTTKDVLYTSANQTTDFGSPQTQYTVDVYQKNTLIGRGRPERATISKFAAEYFDNYNFGTVETRFQNIVYNPTTTAFWFHLYNGTLRCLCGVLETCTGKFTNTPLVKDFRAEGIGQSQSYTSLIFGWRTQFFNGFQRFAYYFRVTNGGTLYFYKGSNSDFSTTTTLLAGPIDLSGINPNAFPFVVECTTVGGVNVNNKISIALGGVLTLLVNHTDSSSPYNQYGGFGLAAESFSFPEHRDASLDNLRIFY